MAEPSPDISLPQRPAAPSLLTACIVVAMGVLSTALFRQAVLEDDTLTRAFVSQLWQDDLLELAGAQVQHQRDGNRLIRVPLTLLLIVTAGGSLLFWLGLGWVIARRRQVSFSAALAIWGTGGWRWLLLLLVWYALWLTALLAGWSSLVTFLAASVELWVAIAIAGFTWEAWALLSGTQSDAAGHRRCLFIVCGGIFVYTIVFTVMNWQLYQGLLLPHGDSAMYEEHLWNVLHGKGFRSYLDQGLFLGEHLQVIHLGLIPLYVLWPSHLLLELCESFALALGALPIYLIARRHTGSPRAAMWLAIAYLLAFPVHFLDIAIDFKTFRPISFGVPVMLFALDQLERTRWKTMVLLLLVALSAKEDYAIIIAPLGLWLAIDSWRSHRPQSPPPATAGRAHSPRVPIAIGLVTCVSSTLYLLFAVKYIIPWFRQGGQVHYSAYFDQFGETPLEIATTMLTDPMLLAGELITVGTVLYALRVLLPIGLLPMLSPGRLAVGLPLFALLCLNQLAQQTPGPVHHFHAPLVPILYWSAAAGLGVVLRQREKVESAQQGWPALSRGRWAVLCALATGVYGIYGSYGPLGLSFWDPGRATYWQTLYVSGERATQFAKIIDQIPISARVASTDFVHPRFTHYERSYDYSKYPRKVADYQQAVPADTDYIVIDTTHAYSEIHSPDDVRELREDPEEWELLPDRTNGYYIVLRRR